MQTDLLVSAESVVRRFGKREVISGLSLSIAPGTVFGLVGLNGAGKTTLIRLLLGLLKADAGSIMVAGEDPWRHSPRLYRNIGIVLEHEGFWGTMSVQRNLELFAGAKGMTARDALNYLDEFWQGSDILANPEKQVRFFSRGQKVQCGLCRAFLGWPKVLLLDEPTVALDVKAYEHFCGLVRDARSRGSAILISSHQLTTIEDLCDEIGILQHGRLSLVDGKKSTGKAAPWIIVADYREPLGAVIKAVTGSEPEYVDGAWRIVVRHPHDEIPRLIRHLVEAGAEIHEVMMVRDGLRETMRGLL